MYPNLEAEMTRYGINREDIADALGIHVTGVYLMLSGQRNLSLYRARIIRDKFFPDMKIDYLFDPKPISGGRSEGLE